MIAPLTVATQTITDILRAANLPANVASTLDIGYPQLVAPFIAVDAPRLTSMEFGLALPRSTVSVPIRVAAATSSDSAGLIVLADAVINALIVGGCAVRSANPVISANGVPAAIPTITINVDMGMKG